MFKTSFETEQNYPFITIIDNTTTNKKSITKVGLLLHNSKNIYEEKNGKNYFTKKNFFLLLHN